MAHQDRDASREGESRLRHQHSASSDHGLRALVPMWDSSDPDRAPPPLPLNPQSPSITSRAGTSSAIQSAHAALSERARESSAAFVPTLTRRANDASPERAAAVKGAATGSHRRMLSMQPGSVRDLSLMLEGSQSASSSPTRSPEKQQQQHRSTTPTPSPSKDRAYDARSLDRHSENSTPVPGPSLTAIARPTARRPPPQSILGENTPPQSSTMLALQYMSSPPSRGADSPLSNITNGSLVGAKSPSTLEHVSKQLLSLTSIATSLQKEMSQLSRRSKDNATDLLSLKEVTSSRDEDIRKSLRDLLGGVTDTTHRLTGRDHFSGLLLDNKPHSPSPVNGRAFQLPRIPSPKSFSDSIDQRSLSTPSLTAHDGPASLALLDKIVRDMGTREGQDSLVSRLTEISERLSGMASSSKVDDLIRYVRSQSENAIIPGHASRRDIQQESQGPALEYEQPKGGPMTQRVGRLLNRGDSRRSSAPPGRGAELLNDDLLNIIKSVKDSVAQGGGLTAEVKALVRELRGEVLGMGRELGKRLEQVSARDVEESDAPNKVQVSRVIDEGLEQMKDQLSSVLREHRRQSATSVASHKTLVDYQEIYNAMRAALRDNEASRSDMPDLNREDVIEAVRDAWANYKPEVEVQQLGLEREEVLACLNEGLQEYAPRDAMSVGATRDEVFQAVVEGLKHFVPPQMDTTATLSRDEIIEAVRDCLEEFEFPVAASAIGNDMTRADMVHAVREGLHDLEIPGARSLGIAPDSDEVMMRLQDIMEYLKLEFRAVSDEAKENMAASGRDTEQVLDATKDGMESLRMAIEGYVDRATGVAGQEEVLEGVLQSLDDFKEELRTLLEQVNDSSREQLQTELEGLRDAVHSSMVPVTGAHAPGSNTEVLEALQTGVANLRQDILLPRAETGQIIDALNDGLNELRAGLDRISNKPMDLTANDEILDALKTGLDSVRADIETLRLGSHDKAVAAVASVDESTSHNAVVPADVLKQDDIKNLEVLITQLRIKVEAMEPEAEHVQKDDLAGLEEMLRSVQQGVDDISSRQPQQAEASAAKEASRGSEDAASRDDVQAIETILRNTKDRLDDLIDGEQAVRKEHLDALEAVILETKEMAHSITEQMDGISHKEDLSIVESLVAQVTLGFEEMKDRAHKESEDPDKVTKADVESVETVVLEIQSAVESLGSTDFATLSNKEDISNLETVMKEAHEKLDALVDTSAGAMEERQAEIVGVGERVSEVRTFLEEFQETVRSRLEDGSGGVEALGKLLETLGEKMEKNENVGDDLKEMFDTMKTEFEDSKDIVTGAKLESDEKLQQATEVIGAKIDDKISELMAKYEEFQAAFDEKSKTGEARDVETEAAIAGTKVVADELKLLVDTLGSSVTDSMERVEEASKTVFVGVEDLASRVDENHADGKTEHQQTRDHVQQTLTALEGMQVEMGDYQPKIFEAVKDVLLLVGQHFEHSKSSASELQDKFVESKASEQAMLPPPDIYDDSEVREKLNRLAEQKYDDSDIHSKLDRLVEQKYDDAHVHEKLDRLVDHTHTAQEAYARLKALDEVHASVVKTGAEMTEFLSNQTQRIADEHQDRERSLEETNTAFERRSVEKDHLDASVMSLKDEESRLRSSVMNLRTEQESLIRQKTRLTGDVSSLETAMRLRKEELSEMESRAERLERRIVEGVMDHSRILLMSQTSKSGDAMTRKRVRKPAVDGSELSRNHSGAARPVVNMALSTKRNLAPPAQTGAAGRRFVSLSQIDSNAASGGVMRSQSVRTPAGGGVRSMRKRSWGGDLAKGFGEADKENIGLRETVEELDEPDTMPADHLAVVLAHSGVTDRGNALGEDDGAASDTDTMRRTSRGTTVTDQYTDSEAGYSGYSGYTDYDETASEWTDGAVGAASSVGPHAAA